MTFQEAVRTCWSKYATFSGRATRSEFWWFYLFAVLVQWLGVLVVAIVTNEDVAQVANLLISLALILPIWAAGARRLHDIDRSGWWQLLVITLIGIFVLIYWWAQPSQHGYNRFGAPPAA